MRRPTTTAPVPPRPPAPSTPSSARACGSVRWLRPRREHDDLAPPHPIAAFVAVLAMLALGLTACGPFGTPEGYLVQARFPRTFNLFPGSPVQILGIERGHRHHARHRGGLRHGRGQHAHRAGRRAARPTCAPSSSPTRCSASGTSSSPPPTRTGPTFEAGGMIEEPGDVPAEFDEVLDALNDFVDNIEGGDLPRLVDNLAGRARRQRREPRPDPRGHQATPSTSCGTTTRTSSGWPPS